MNENDQDPNYRDESGRFVLLHCYVCGKTKPYSVGNYNWCLHCGWQAMAKAMETQDVPGQL